MTNRSCSPAISGRSCEDGRISRTPDVPAGAIVDMNTPPPISGGAGGVIPLQAPEGKQLLCARVDPGDAVGESNEANNVTASR